MSFRVSPNYDISQPQQSISLDMLPEYKEGTSTITELTLSTTEILKLNDITDSKINRMPKNIEKLISQLTTISMIDNGQTSGSEQFQHRFSSDIIINDLFLHFAKGVHVTAFTSGDITISGINITIFKNGEEFKKIHRSLTMDGVLDSADESQITTIDMIVGMNNEQFKRNDTIGISCEFEFTDNSFVGTKVEGFCMLYPYIVTDIPRIFTLPQIILNANQDLQSKNNVFESPQESSEIIKVGN